MSGAPLTRMADIVPTPPAPPKTVRRSHVVLGGAGVVVLGVVAAVVALRLDAVLFLVDFGISGVLLNQSGDGEPMPLQLAGELGIVLAISGGTALALASRRAREAKSVIGRHPGWVFLISLAALDAALVPSAGPGPSPLAGAAIVASGVTVWIVGTALLFAGTRRLVTYGWRSARASPFAAGILSGAGGVVGLVATAAVVWFPDPQKKLLNMPSSVFESGRGVAQGGLGLPDLAGLLSDGGGDGGSGECLIKVLASDECSSHRSQAKRLLYNRSYAQGNADDEDIVEDAALTTCMRNPPDPNPCATFVTAVDNRSKDRYRTSLVRARALTAAPPSCPVPGADDEVIAEERGAIVRAMIGRLPDADRSVLEAWLKEPDQTFNSLGLRIGSSSDAARMRHKRALTRLRSMILEQCPELVP